MTDEYEPDDLLNQIDEYVDQLFRQESSQSSEPLTGEVLSGDWRIDRIDEIIQDTYDEAIWWHNNRISEGTDPRSGLRSLPYVPWDERIDGQAAMMGNAGINDSSYERNGASWAWEKAGVSVEVWLYAKLEELKNAPPAIRDSGTNSLIWGLIALLVVVGLSLYMMLGIPGAALPALAVVVLLFCVFDKD